MWAFFFYVKDFSWEHLERNKKKLEKAVYREKTVDRKEKISRKITTVFHSKEINMKNVIYYSVNNKRIFMK